MPSHGRADNPSWQSRIVGEAELDPATIADHPDNWRLHPALQQRALAGVLDEIGWVQRVLVNRRSGRLIDGHLRVALARERGETSIPVQYVDLSEAEEAAVLATLDPLAGLARADAVALDRTLQGVTTDSDAVQQLLERVAAGAGLTLDSAGAVPADDLPDAPPSRTRPGDCWQLGLHWLLCADATDPAALTALMRGERAALLATDPPFFVDYDGTNHPGGDRHDDRPRPAWDHSPGEAQVTAFYTAYLQSALAVTIPGVAIYQWHADRRRAQVQEAWAAAGLLVHQSLIWVKPYAVPGHSHYGWQHEPALYGWPQGAPPPLRPAASASTVWTIARDGDRVGHPTQKPVELFRRPIRAHTAPGDAVLEPFAGSGSQIIAAEQTGRRCFAVEQDPAYVDLAVARWEAFTGRDAQVLRS